MFDVYRVEDEVFDHEVFRLLLRILLPTRSRMAQHCSNPYNKSYHPTLFSPVHNRACLSCDPHQQSERSLSESDNTKRRAAGTFMTLASFFHPASTPSTPSCSLVLYLCWHLTDPFLDYFLERYATQTMFLPLPCARYSDPCHVCLHE